MVTKQVFQATFLHFVQKQSEFSILKVVWGHHSVDLIDIGRVEMLNVDRNEFHIPELERAGLWALYSGETILVSVEYHHLFL